MISDTDTRPTKQTLNRLADLANISRRPRPRGGVALHGWLSHRPIHLPPAVIPDRCVTAVENVSSTSLFPRIGHTVSEPTPDGDVYIFGGRLPPSSNVTYMNDLWLYSTKDNTTTLIQCYGDLPSPRIWSSIALIGKILVLWGGRGENGDFDDDVYLLDLVSHEWTQVRVHGWAPVSRAEHAFATVGSALFIFGGLTKQDDSFQRPSGCLNDIWSFDLNTLRTQPVWEAINPTSSEIPYKRYGHQWVLYQNQLITYGGCRDDSIRPSYKDIWSFDLGTSSWTCYGSFGSSGRHHHAAAVVDGKMYIYGGVKEDMLGATSHLCDLVIYKIFTEEQPVVLEPTLAGPRSGHSMVSVGSSLYVLGGETSAKRNDMDIVHALDTAKLFEELGPQHGE